MAHFTCSPESPLGGLKTASEDKAFWGESPDSPPPPNWDRTTGWALLFPFQKFPDIACHIFNHKLIPNHTEAKPSQIKVIIRDSSNPAARGSKSSYIYQSADLQCTCVTDCAWRPLSFFPCCCLVSIDIYSICLSGCDSFNSRCVHSMLTAFNWQNSSKFTIHLNSEFCQTRSTAKYQNKNTNSLLHQLSNSFWFNPRKGKLPQEGIYFLWFFSNGCSCDWLLFGLLSTHEVQIQRKRATKLESFFQSSLQQLL